MLLFAFLLSLPSFPHVSYSKQFLVELKTGKNQIIETNNGTGTGENGNGKNDEGKKQSRPKKGENGETALRVT